MSAQRDSGVGQATTAAPYTCISVFIVSGAEASVKITHGSPTRAEYAAVEAPWLPVEAIVITRAPTSTAWVTATEQRRFFHDHVGLWLSSLAHSRRRPHLLPRGSRWFRVVGPSPGDTTGPPASRSPARDRPD